MGKRDQYRAINKKKGSIGSTLNQGEFTSEKIVKGEIKRGEIFRD